MDTLNAISRILMEELPLINDYKLTLQPKRAAYTKRRAYKIGASLNLFLEIFPYSTMRWIFI
jgi:hypothetical protein